MSFIIVELSNSTSAKEQLKGIEMREVDIYTIVALTKKAANFTFSRQNTSQSLSLRASLTSSDTGRKQLRISMKMTLLWGDFGTLVCLVAAEDC
jgi:hypothetical protein